MAYQFMPFQTTLNDQKSFTCCNVLTCSSSNIRNAMQCKIVNIIECRKRSILPNLTDTARRPDHRAL